MKNHSNLLGFFDPNSICRNFFPLAPLLNFRQYLSPEKCRVKFYVSISSYTQKFRRVSWWNCSGFQLIFFRKLENFPEFLKRYLQIGSLLKILEDIQTIFHKSPYNFRKVWMSQLRKPQIPRNSVIRRNCGYIIKSK